MIKKIRERGEVIMIIVASEDKAEKKTKEKNDNEDVLPST